LFRDEGVDLGSLSVEEVCDCRLLGGWGKNANKTAEGVRIEAKSRLNNSS
jgi:hypothetical protein